MIQEARARWWRKDAERIVCELCPHHCRFKTEGARGLCGPRFRKEGELWTQAWGGAGAVHLDPVEKKPLYHFLPGSWTYSLGMFGCNLSCVHCQNWSLSTERKAMALPVPLSPTQIALAALDQGATSVSFTYNEPLISAEFWIEVAQECHRYGLRIISVTNGYANPVCCKDFFSNMDATNVDLKGFSESFYRKVCKGRLAPVLKNLVVIRELGTCHLEITNLLIPHQNDSTEELRGLSKWVVANLGVDTPVHFSAFHPDFRAMDWNQATSRDVDRARAIAQEEGLHYVYTGNVPKSRGSDTFCPSCGELLIERGGFGVLESHLRQGKCPFCGLAVPGTFQVA